MSTPIAKKANTGRKSSYDGASNQSIQSSSFRSSLRDALVKEDHFSGSPLVEENSIRSSSLRDARFRKGARHQYNTRSTSRIAPAMVNALTGAPNTELSTGSHDDDAAADNFHQFDEILVADSNCGSVANPIIESIDGDCTGVVPALSEEVRTPFTAAGDSSCSYDFTAVSETPPRDTCLARDCFDAALNQTAEDYLLMRERRRLRDIEVELLMGTLGVANQDEIISVADIREFTETRIASFGVTSVAFTTENSEVTVVTSGELNSSETFPLAELPGSGETVIFNGKISPFPTPREGKEVYPLKSGSYSKDSCTLCSSEDSLYQFKTRHRKENLKHMLAHGVCINSTREDSGNLYETEFSADVTLIGANYNRPYNFLPTASSMHEAVEIICEDDYIPFSQWLDDFQILELGIQCISSLSLLKLLKFYYCIVNSTYDIRGNTVRHVQMCRGDIPTL